MTDHQPFEVKLALKRKWTLKQMRRLDFDIQGLSGSQGITIMSREVVGGGWSLDTWRLIFNGQSGISGQKQSMDIVTTTTTARSQYMVIYMEYTFLQRSSRTSLG